MSFIGEVAGNYVRHPVLSVMWAAGAYGSLEFGEKALEAWPQAQTVQHMGHKAIEHASVGDYKNAALYGGASLLACIGTGAMTAKINIDTIFS